MDMPPHLFESLRLASPCKPIAVHLKSETEDHRVTVRRGLTRPLREECVELAFFDLLQAAVLPMSRPFPKFKADHGRKAPLAANLHRGLRKSPFGTQVTEEQRVLALAAEGCELLIQLLLELEWLPVNLIHAPCFSRFATRGA